MWRLYPAKAPAVVVGIQVVTLRHTRRGAEELRTSLFNPGPTCKNGQQQRRS